MFSVSNSVRLTSKKISSLRSFATVKNTKPFYRKLINPTTVGLAAVGGLLWYGYAFPYDKEAYIQSLDNPTAYELETLTPKQVAAHTFLLNRTGSRLMGKVMNIELPVSWRKPVYSYVSRVLGIDVSEFQGTFEDYPTPNSFFTRDLRPNTRPILQNPKTIVSPVDGTVSIMDEVHFGGDKNIQLHQVKGVTYSLREFLGSHPSLANPSNNLYSIVIYLSPSNYHHVHSPVEFGISDRVHVPGHLLPVKESYVAKVKGLFTLNERVILSGSWREGFFALGMVGAYNVGSIKLNNVSDPIETNQPHELVYTNYHHHKHYDSVCLNSIGDRVGTFALGSTVVMAFEAPRIHWLVEPGEKVKLGQPIGYVGDKEEAETIRREYEEMKEKMMKVDQNECVEEIPMNECDCEQENEIEGCDDKEIDEEMEPVETTPEEVAIAVPVELVISEPEFSEPAIEETVEEIVVDEWGVTKGRKEEDFW